MPTPPLFAVIMAGGSGTRFWPASRRSRPKQFLSISGRGSLIAETLARLAGLVPRERTYVVTAAEQVPLVRETLPDLPAENVLGEPQAKNTAPCVGYAAHVLHERHGECVLAVLPADHVIEPAESFRASLRAAADEACQADALITFGIRPTFPATGYGYIEAGALLHRRAGSDVFAVARFVEKPSRERAAEFLASGRFLWNSGMFVWRASVVLAAFRAHSPAIARGLERLGAGADLAEVYAGWPSAAVDVEILERAENVRLLPIDYRWSDVGSWAALPEVHAPDEAGNWSVLAHGTRLVAEDSSGCVTFAEDQDELVALVGVRDLVVVRSGRTTLIVPRERAQEVKRVVERLREEAPEFL